MALRTFNDTSGDHLWSTAANWSTSAPTSGVDYVTIAAGKLCLFDIPTFVVTGGPLTINSGATLQCPDDGTVGSPTSHTLTLTGGNITGTGELKAGTSTSSPLSQYTKFIIDGGNTNNAIAGSYGLIVNLFCSEPPHPLVKLTQSESALTTQVHIDTNLTAETAFWYAGAPLVIANVSGTFDYQGVGNNPRTLASIDDATHLTLSSTGLDSTYVTESYIVLATRNIEVQISGANYAFASVTGGNINCSIRQTGATQNGRGVHGSVNCTVGGVVSGNTYGINSGSGHVINSTVTGNNYGIYYGSGHVINGTVTGNNYGINSGSGHTISGTVTGNACGIIYGSGHVINSTVTGNTYGIYYGSGHVINGTVTGNNYGINSGSGHVISGTVTGNAYGIIYGSGHTISGTVTGNTYGIYYGSVILGRGCVFGSNTRDVYNDTSGYATVVGRGAELGSSTQVNTWKRSDIPVKRYDIGTFLYDVAATSGGAPQIGRVKCWMPGGRMWSEPVSGGEPFSFTYVHHGYCEDNLAQCFIDFPVLAKNGKLISITAWIKLSTSGGWIQRPTLKIIDPDYDFGNISGILASTTADDNTDWQTKIVSYMPTSDRILTFRTEAIDLTKEFYWNFTQDILETSFTW